MAGIETVIGPFVSEAAARGSRPPVALVDHDTRGWELCARGTDRLFLDEFGDLWWGSRLGTTQARILRPCWPEERRSLAPTIEAALAALDRRDAATR
jgi:hypothetical protein